MPRATDNRKAVGTEHCDECGTLARFYQVQKGNRTGYLYRRCECGADQKTGAAIQTRWINRMARTDEPMIPHPLDQVREAAPEPKPTPAQPSTDTHEPRATSEGNPKPAGLVGVAVLLAGVALAVLT